MTKLHLHHNPYVNFVITDTETRGNPKWDIAQRKLGEL